MLLGHDYLFGVCLPCLLHLILIIVSSFKQIFFFYFNVLDQIETAVHGKTLSSVYKTTKNTIRIGLSNHIIINYSH